MSNEQCRIKCQNVRREMMQNVALGKYKQHGTNLMVGWNKDELSDSLLRSNTCQHCQRYLWDQIPNFIKKYKSVCRDHRRKDIKSWYMYFKKQQHKLWRHRLPKYKKKKPWNTPSDSICRPVTVVAGGVASSQSQRAHSLLLLRHVCGVASSRKILVQDIAPNITWNLFTLVSCGCKWTSWTIASWTLKSPVASVDDCLRAGSPWLS